MPDAPDDRMVPLAQVLKIITNARQPIYSRGFQSLSEMDRHLDTILNTKSTIIRHLMEAFPK